MVPDEFKPAYGRILARTPDPYQAALILVPDNIGYALWVSNTWRNDPVVIEHRKLEWAEIDKENQISKSDLTKRLLDIVDSDKEEARDRVAAARLVAEVNGLIEKPGPVVSNNVNNVPTYRVVNIPAFESPEAWEAAAKQQQADSLNVATSRH